VGFVVDKVALGRFSLSTVLWFPLQNIIPPLLHIHLYEVCDCSDQAAHYHNLGPKLGASLVNRHIGWKQKKKVKKNIISGLGNVTCTVPSKSSTIDLLFSIQHHFLF
jgi:hypothetical protein